jgi:hypothetical protein
VLPAPGKSDSSGTVVDINANGARRPSEPWNPTCPPIPLRTNDLSQDSWHAARHWLADEDHRPPNAISELTGHDPSITGLLDRRLMNADSVSRRPFGLRRHRDTARRPGGLLRPHSIRPIAK